MVTIEREISEIFHRMIEEISELCKNETTYRKDWLDDSYSISITDKTHCLQYVYAKIHFYENHVVIESIRRGRQVIASEASLEYKDPKCNTEEIAKILDTFIV